MEDWLTCNNANKFCPRDGHKIEKGGKIIPAPPTKRETMDKIWKLFDSYVFTEEWVRKSYDLDRDVEKEAKRYNSFVVRPKPNQLQIDIDCDEQYNFFRGKLDDLERFHEFNVLDYEEHVSKSGLPCRHITLSFDRNFTDSERILLQFALGSDFIRESMNTLRVILNGNSDCIFFEQKEKGEKK